MPRVSRVFFLQLKYCLLPRWLIRCDLSSLGHKPLSTKWCLSAAVCNQTREIHQVNPPCLTLLSITSPVIASTLVTAGRAMIQQPQYRVNCAYYGTCVGGLLM